MHSPDSPLLLDVTEASYMEQYLQRPCHVITDHACQLNMKQCRTVGVEASMYQEEKPSMYINNK